MKVYVAEVAVDEYEPTYLVGVYTSEELASKAIATWLKRERWPINPDTARVIIDVQLDELNSWEKSR